MVFGVVADGLEEWLAMGMMPLEAELTLIEAMSEEVLIEFMLLALAPIAVGPMDGEEEAEDEEFWVIEEAVAAIVVTGSEVELLIVLVLNEFGME